MKEYVDTYKEFEKRITNESVYLLKIPIATSRNPELKEKFFENMSASEFYLDDSNIDQCYQLYLIRQTGDTLNKRDTIVLFRLPKSKMLVQINLYKEGWGANYDAKYHKYVLRETDELDRRIVLGFCIKYAHSLAEASYKTALTRSGYNEWMTGVICEAAFYDHTKMPKRLDTKRGVNEIKWNFNHLTPVNEVNLFMQPILV